MTNRGKDILFFLLVIFVIVFAIFACGFWIGKSYAGQPAITELTEQALINKYYTEESIKNEMSFLSMWHYVENMSEQEYYETFFKDDRKEYEYVRQNFADR